MEQFLNGDVDVEQFMGHFRTGPPPPPRSPAAPPLRASPPPAAAAAAAAAAATAAAVPASMMDGVAEDLADACISNPMMTLGKGTQPISRELI